MTFFGALPGVDHDAEQLHELVAEVLRGPRFADASPGWLARLADELTRAIAWFVDTVFGPVSGSATLAWLVVLVAVAVLAAVVWRFTRGATVDRRRAVVPPDLQTRTAAYWRAQAAEHEAAGQLAEAVLARYRAAVTGLVEAGLLDDVPGRTVRELDAETSRRAPTLAPTLAAAGGALERVWYGHEPAGEAHLIAVRDADDVVRRLHGRVRLELR